MMKKLLLLMISGCVASGAMAQSDKKAVIIKDDNHSIGTPITTDFTKITNKRSANKTSQVGGTRWFFPIDNIASYMDNEDDLNNNTFVYLIGFDSTYIRTYVDPVTNVKEGIPVNYVGFGQFFDPIYAEGFSSADYLEAGANPNEVINISTGNDYKVDSVMFRGAYIESSKGGPGVVDTLIISIVPTTYAEQSFKASSTYDVSVDDYEGVTANGGTLRIPTMPGISKATRGFTSSSAITWMVPLDASMRQPESATGYPTTTFRLPVDDGKRMLDVPAGRGVAMSISFKPGEPKVAGRDSAVDYHYFMFSAANQDQYDTKLYPYFRYAANDRNMSFYIHYRQLDAGRFISPVELELYNGERVGQELLINGIHVECATCNTLSIQNVNNKAITAKVYPNPATAEVRVPFQLGSQSDVNISLTNTVGQVVKAQSFKATTEGVAVFNTTDLANGVYIYSIEANGQRHTGRVTVSH